MNAGWYALVMVTFIGIFSGCQDKAENTVARIAVLEQELAATSARGKADTLAQLYREMVRPKPRDAADLSNNTRYLTRAAEIHYLYRDDAVNAVRSLDEVVNTHGKGLNLTEAVGLLARIWSAYKYKSGPTVMLHPDDIDKMQENLSRNQVWIDSSLARLDAAMGSVATSNREKAGIFVETAEGYAALVQSKDPEKAADLLMKAAGVAKNIGNFNKAIQLYYTVSDKLQPPVSKAPTALFMQAFVYENDLTDLTKAKAAYQDFLKRYPKDEFADDAQQALKMLGKSPEDIIREFEKKNPPKQQ